MMSPKSSDIETILKAPDGGTRFECRICLNMKRRSKATDIFVPWSFSGNEASIATHITNITNVEISEIDGWPKLICTDCLNRLCLCLTFVDKVKQADQVLKNRQQNEETAGEKVQNDKGGSEKTWPKPIQLDKSINGETLPLDIEIKQEVISDEELEETTSDDNRQDCEILLDIKVEPEEITEQSLPIQVTVNGTISQDQFSSLNGCEDNGTEEYLSSTSVKEEPLSDDDQIPADMPLECLLCAKTFRTIAGLKAHVITQHSYKSVKRKAENSPSPERKRPSLTDDKTTRKYFACGICRRSFLTSTDLRVHETCHNKFCCFACNAKFDTFREVTDHRRRCKVKAQVVKPKTLGDAIRERAKMDTEASSKNKKPQCDICKLTFRDALYLRLHNAEQHPKEDTTNETENRTEETEIRTEKAENITEEKNQEKDLQIKVKTEKCKEDDRKYSKIETELESIFEYAVEKDELKGGEINESVYSDSREQLEKTLGDNGAGNTPELNEKVEVVIEKVDDSQKRITEQSQESCEQNVNTGTIEFSNSEIDQPQIGMDKIDINILSASTATEASNIEMESLEPSNLQVNTNIDKDSESMEQIEIQASEKDSEPMEQIEIQVSKIEDKENIIECSQNSQKVDKTEFIECLEQKQ